MWHVQYRNTYYILIARLKQRDLFEDPKQDGRIISKSRKVMYENAVWIQQDQDKNH